MPTQDALPRRPLTRQQDEQRLRGLRALARLIARAHLAAAGGDAAARNGARPGAGAGPRAEEDRHAR